MVRRLALGAVVASTVLVTLAYASAFLPAGAPSWAPWAFVVGTAAMMTAMMMLGASRPGRPLGGLWLAFLFTFVVLVGGFGIAIVLPPPTAGGALWLGLPAGAAAVLYGVGLLPLAVLPLAYAMTFDDRTLSEADLARLRAAAAELGSGGGGPGSSDPGNADAEGADGGPVAGGDRGTDAGRDHGTAVGAPPQRQYPGSASRTHHPPDADRTTIPPGTSTDAGVTPPAAGPLH